MSQTFTLPSKLVNEVDALSRELSLGDVEATIQYLLENAIAREKKFLIARLYQNRQKTIRQCAELLHVDLEEMMDILREFRIPFNDDLAQQLETVDRLASRFSMSQT